MFGSELEISRYTFTYRTGGWSVADCFHNKTSFHAKKKEIVCDGSNQSAIKIHVCVVTLTNISKRKSRVSCLKICIKDTCRLVGYNRLRDLQTIARPFSSNERKTDKIERQKIRNAIFTRLTRLRNSYVLHGDSNIIAYCGSESVPDGYRAIKD